MSPTPRFPGQEELIRFDLEQVKALASPQRNEVFWAFNKDDPTPVAAIATALGKSAASVHYHVHELVRVGLLMSVGTRKQRSRIEQLYVHAAADFIGRGVTAPKEYRRYIYEGFAAMARAMTRENLALHRALDEDPNIVGFHSYNRRSLRLTVEDARELRRRLNEVVDRFEDSSDPEHAKRVTVIAYISPTMAESKLWSKRRTKEKD